MKSVRDAMKSAGIVEFPASVREAAKHFGFETPVSLITLLDDGIKPEVKTFHGDVVTPAGTSLGGWVDMTVRGDGSYSIRFHLHDSGIPGYDFVVRAIFTTPGGMAIVSQFSGHVEGTDSTTLSHAPNRDSDYEEKGVNPAIQANWPDVRNGELSVTKEYSTGGVVGFVEDVAKAVLTVGAGAVGGALAVVILLGAEINQEFKHFGIGGVFGLLAGVVIFEAGGSLMLATVTGVEVGLVTDALIKQRSLSQSEDEFAYKVFDGTLPNREDIILTNLSGLGGRKFTIPGVDGKIYVNLGDAYDDPAHHTEDGYPVPGQVLIHELTHAWQIKHSSFIPGIVCKAVENQADYLFWDVYKYGPPGPVWSAFNLEQQAAIVDQWFGGISVSTAPHRTKADPKDPYYVYIRDNIQAGVV